MRVKQQGMTWEIIAEDHGEYGFLLIFLSALRLANNLRPLEIIFDAPGQELLVDKFLAMAGQEQQCNNRKALRNALRLGLRCLSELEQLSPNKATSQSESAHNQGKTKQDQPGQSCPVK